MLKVGHGPVDHCNSRLHKLNDLMLSDVKSSMLLVSLPTTPNMIGKSPSERATCITSCSALAFMSLSSACSGQGSEALSVPA